jgi:murein DD-endopeptidase MepM/ murein hydrolase activator NlpD
VRRIAIVLAAAALRCAAPSHDKMSWSEVMPPRPAAPARKVDLKKDAAFGAALQAFIDAGQASRKDLSGGAAMPLAQVSAWTAVLAEVDAFLSRPAKQQSAFDAARARVVLEGELELDAQAYGDIPEQVPVAAQAAVKGLSARLGELLTLRDLKHVDPRRFVWPVSPVVVTSPFGDRVHPITGDYRMHRGVDLLAELAQPVHAAFAGTVVFAGWNGAHGKQVQLVHDGHWGTHYSHLSSWWVSNGDVVAKGQVIGVAGSTGESTGPHVHFELVHDGETVDPEGQLPEPPPAPAPVAWQ